MKLKDTIIFSLAVAFFIIGIHQAITIGFEFAYWLFMLSIGLLLWYNMRKNKHKEQDPSKSSRPGKKSKK